MKHLIIAAVLALPATFSFAGSCDHQLLLALPAVATTAGSQLKTAHLAVTGLLTAAQAAAKNQ